MAARFKMTSVKKAVKSKGVTKKWLSWYSLMNYVLIPSEAEIPVYISN